MGGEVNATEAREATSSRDGVTNSALDKKAASTGGAETLPLTKTPPQNLNAQCPQLHKDLPIHSYLNTQDPILGPAALFLPKFPQLLDIPLIISFHINLLKSSSIPYK